MATVEELEKRLAGLEAKVAASGLDRVGHLDGSYRIVVADLDGDGDCDPWLSASWNGNSFSTGTGTIDWNADMGVPSSAKMVFVLATIRDSSATGSAGQMSLQAKSTTTSFAWVCYSKASDALASFAGWVPVSQDGTSYYSLTASGSNTLDIWLRVPAYAR